MSVRSPGVRRAHRPGGGAGRRRFGGIGAVVAIAGAALCSGCGLSLQSAPKFGSMTGPSYELHAVFANVLNLPADAQVNDGPAVVGQVSSITTRDFHADLTLRIQRGVKLPVGTTAQVRFNNPLGDEFILLTPPKVGRRPAWLANGSVLPLAQTGTAPSVEDTLVALSAVLNGGGIDQLETIVSQLNDTFSGNQPQIRGFLVQLDDWVTSLNANRNDLDDALAAVGNLATQLNAGSNVIASGIDSIGPATGVLADENDDLRQLLAQMTQLSTVTNALIAQSGQASVNDVKQLLPVVDQLVGVEQQIGPDLQDIANFEVDTPKVAPGNYLQVSVTLHALLSPNPTTATAASVEASGPPGGPSATSSPTATAVSALLEGGLP